MIRRTNMLQAYLSKKLRLAEGMPDQPQGKANDRFEQEKHRMSCSKHERCCSCVMAWTPMQVKTLFEAAIL
jgi:hypothetical protein